VTPTFRVLACDALTDARLGYLDVQELAFNDPVRGISSLSGKAVLSPSQNADKLDLLTREEAVALYVTGADVYWWAGVIKQRTWDPVERSWFITGVGWKDWLDHRFIGPNIATNPVSDVTYGYTSTDQLTIAQNVINFAITGIGTPNIVNGGETSGVLRDLNWLGSDFRSAYSLIDSMATRENGFDWAIQAFTDGTTGLPSLRFVPFYPARGGQSVALTFRKVPNGGNIIVDQRIDFNSADKRTRVWTTGKGTPPDRPMVYDQDPDVTAGLTLLTETTSNYQAEGSTAKLGLNARAERRYRSTRINSMSLKALFKEIDPTLYFSGDRVQLIYQDEGVNLAYPAVRIVDRAMHINNTDGVDYAELLLDLADTELPDNTAQV
jgi:hypothetical protein